MRWGGWEDGQVTNIKESFLSLGFPEIWQKFQTEELTESTKNSEKTGTVNETFQIFRPGYATSAAIIYL